MTIARTLMIAAVTFTMIAAWASASILAETRLHGDAGFDPAGMQMNIVGLTIDARNLPVQSFEAI